MEAICLNDDRAEIHVLLNLRLLEEADCDDLSLLFEEMQTHYTVFCPPRETIAANLRNLPAGPKFLLRRTIALSPLLHSPQCFLAQGCSPGSSSRNYSSQKASALGIGRQLLQALGALCLDAVLAGSTGPPTVPMLPSCSIFMTISEQAERRISFSIGWMVMR